MTLCPSQTTAPATTKNAIATGTAIAMRATLLRRLNISAPKIIEANHLRSAQEGTPITNRAAQPNELWGWDG
jgi:hypothetical protein